MHCSCKGIPSLYIASYFVTKNRLYTAFHVLFIFFLSLLVTRQFILIVLPLWGISVVNFVNIVTSFCKKISKTGLFVMQTLLPQVVWSQITSRSVLFMETASDIYISTFPNVTIWIIVSICPSGRGTEMCTDFPKHVPLPIMLDHSFVLCTEMLLYLFFINIYSIMYRFLLMKTYIKVTNKSYHFHPKMSIVLILDDENNYYIFETVTILLFNNEINITNKINSLWAILL